jgi:protein TonB
MFGVLIESRARRQRRTGGAVLSAASHLAIVSVVTAFSARGPAHAAPPEKPIVVHVAYPNEPAPREQRRASTAPTSQSSTTIVAPKTIIIDVPQVTPVGLPPIQPASGVSLDSLIIGGSHSGAKGLGQGLIDNPSSEEKTEWRGNDLLMRIVEQSKPRYPEMLRQAGIGGRVLIRFVVDTLGRVDPASVTVVQATHEQFANAARAALTGFRFRPAEVNGRRVRALAEMPFEFLVASGKW